MSTLDRNAKIVKIEKTSLPLDLEKGHRQKWEQNIEHHGPEHLDKGEGVKLPRGSREFPKGESGEGNG